MRRAVHIVDHDVAGGHTVSTPVNKTKASLQHRLDSKPKREATSSFPNLATADFAQAAHVKKKIGLRSIIGLVVPKRFRLKF